MTVLSWIQYVLLFIVVFLQNSDALQNLIPSQWKFPTSSFVTNTKSSSKAIKLENELLEAISNVNNRLSNDEAIESLIVSLEQPNRKVKVDTLEYVMANPDGTLLGEGFADIKENKLVYKKNEKFNQKGIYKISIKQAVRQTGKITGVEKLEGISDVGFRIESKE